MRADDDGDDQRALAHITLSGRVQGVWFRKTTRQEATNLGLRGWVRNLPDGRVEAVAEGRRDAIEALISFCRHGPPLARVDEVAVDWREPTGEHDRFEIL